MSVTLIAWMLTGALLAMMAFSRPAWAVALYMLTYFLCPPYWWWGDPLEGYRWNLYSGNLLLVTAFLLGTWQYRRAADRRLLRRMAWLAVGMVVNAGFVHVALAGGTEISADELVLLSKFVLLFFLIPASIRSEADLRIVLLSIVLGAGYIGYETTINDRGKFAASRLEGVGAPSAATANDLACLMVSVLPIAGGLFLVGRGWEKLVAVVFAPMILNTVFLCNSRGALLAAIMMAVIFLVASPAQIRRKVMKLVALGVITAWFLMGDPRILERFATTFVGGEELDRSATSRLDYWKAGMRMISDHPLGAGGDGFKKVHGPKYIRAVTGVEFQSRSVHNGYINEACAWGIQGLALRLGFLITAALVLYRTARAARAAHDDRTAIVSTALLAGLSGMMLQAIFGTFLASEWGYWIAGLAVGLNRLSGERAAQATPVVVPELAMAEWNVRARGLVGPGAISR